jgi:ADP-ribose pyrophosphatase
MTLRAKKSPGKRKNSPRGTGARSGSALPAALHENPWFSVRKRGRYYTIEYRQEQAIILPIVDNRGVVMVRVKRPVINDTPLELPAGGIDAGETPVVGAAREFAEETGIAISDISRFVPLPSLSPSPNRTPTRLHVFRVDITGEEFAQRGLHDDEITGVEHIPLDELANRIINGDIYVAVPVAVLATFLLSGTINRRAGRGALRKTGK